MPYKCVGSTLYSKKGGQWGPKSHHDSERACQNTMRMLYSIAEQKKEPWTNPKKKMESAKIGKV